MLKLQSAFKKLREEQEKVVKGRSAKKLFDSFCLMKAHLLRKNADNLKLKVAEGSLKSSLQGGKGGLLENELMTGCNLPLLTVKAQ